MPKAAKQAKTVKKSVKKAVKKSAKPSQSTGRIGRPEGIKNPTCDTIGLASTQEFTSRGVPCDPPGLKRVTLFTTNPEMAPMMKRLADMIDKQPERLVKWLKTAK
jgi:hypothetical protein